MTNHNFNACTIWIPGLARPKGSLFIMARRSAKPIMRGREPYYRIRDLWTAPNKSTRNGKKVNLLKPWMDLIVHRATWNKPREPLDGPFCVEAEFYFPRPQKPAHPTLHIVPPDLDKLIRAVGDALTGVFWIDDGQISTWICHKRYCGKSAPKQEPGLLLSISYLGQQQELF